MHVSSALLNAGSSTPSTPPPQNTQSTLPPQDTQHTPPLQNTQSATPHNTNNISNTDSLITAADAAAVLWCTSTLIRTKDGLIANQTGASLVLKAKVKFLSNKAWSLTTSDGKALEFTITLTPHSTWAFNNGPGGNFTQMAWKTGDKLVNSIEITPNANSGQSEDTWTKLTCSGLELGVTCHMNGTFKMIFIFSDQCLFSFKNSFLYPHLAEYAVSGRPVQWDMTIEIHNTIDRHWEVRIFVCFYINTGQYHQKEDHQRTHIIDVSVGHRPVFVMNTTTMDEGRASEYEGKFKLLPFFGDSDLRYNRVPEVVIYNSITKKYSPVSFHHIHRLGQGLVMNMTVAPMVSLHSRQLSWEYCLVNITILSCVTQIIDLSLDDSSEEEKQPSPKKLSAGKSFAGGKSGAAAA
ncbi:hypothetical protein DFH08DRAFT_813546 [Mycena albidolilacea]|uniref:Uncharacterized protein n=1 Tax=Mycena albidolilacea TaxID=1033008 RepID=A0AAD6ZT15_9AGAR|nr:hypothetical protein DFH08DRAFT_813546 [Mycena albidolilacea]